LLPVRQLTTTLMLPTPPRRMTPLLLMMRTWQLSLFLQGCGLC